MPKRRTKEEYIQELNKIHNNSYDYSLIELIHSHKKVRIVCKKHGEFEIRFSSHFQGQRCPTCVKYENIEIEHLKVLERIKSKNFIDGCFKDDKTNSYKFNCDIHGEYKRSPQSIRVGIENCPSCSPTAKKSLEYYQDLIKKLTNGNTLIITDEEFLSLKKQYNFECKKHGNFSRKLELFVKHPYCNKCGTKSKLTTTEFIEKASKIHDGSYDYSNTKYDGYYGELDIICKKHGKFTQTPNVHLAGGGCPKCKSSKGEKEIRRVLNKYSIEYSEQKKFSECKNIAEMKFDFFLPKYNMVIEFHGRQHYFPVKWSKSDTDLAAQNRLKYIQNNDLIKKNYCIENNIMFLEISYKEKKNAEKIIVDFLINKINTERA